MFKNFYQKISSLAPHYLVKKTAALLVQGGFEEISAREFLGFSVFFSTCVAAIAFFVSHLFTGSQAIIAAATIAGFAVMQALFYLFLLMAADSRAQKIEALLPDVLEIISVNLRAGMTLENAVWSAARPEFGPLEAEIKKVSADTFGGKPITATLMQMTKRVKSDTLERAMKLMVEGIHLGGEMSKLLKEVAADTRNAQLLKKEIATSTMMYSIFIIFAAVIISPLLFAVSVYYTEMNEALLAKQVGGGGGLPSEAVWQAGVAGGVATGFAAPGQQRQLFSSSEVKLFAMSCIVLTTFFAGVLLSLIRFGKAVRGIKYVPVFVVAGLSIFLLAHSFLTAVFKAVIK